MTSLSKGLALGAAAGLLAAAPVRAAVLKPLNLEELTRRADRIFSGTVTAVEKGRAAMGGRTLPTITYRVAVDRRLAGAVTKPGSQVAEIRMLGDLEEVRRGDRVRVRRPAPRPTIETGQRYLFFVTAPGRVGLSTTVGLGQGCFRIGGDPADEDAVNQFDNVGLFRGMNLDRAAPGGAAARGPVKLSVLAERISSLRVRQ